MLKRFLRNPLPYAINKWHDWRKHVIRQRYAFRSLSSPANGKPFVSAVEVSAQGRKLLLTANGSLDLCELAGEIFIDQCYCPPDLPVRIRPGNVVVDIGANIGTFTCYAALFDPMVVVAVEPVPSNFEVLSANVAANCPGRVSPVLSAVSTVNRTGEMVIFEKGMTGCRLPAPKLDGNVRQDCPRIPVECLTLPAIMERSGIHRIDFLKMDCEGEEFSIIYELEKELLRAIPTIALEYHDGAGKGFSGDLAQYLKDQGFTVAIRETPGRSSFLGYLYAWRP